MLKRGLTRDLLISLGFLMDEIAACSFTSQMQRIHCGGWYQRSSFGPIVSKLLSIGEIEKVEKDGNLYYRLTSKGTDKIKEDIPLLKLAGKQWDGYWRIVIFDIPEKERLSRDILREKLLLLGFGKWQESVYLSPHQIEQEINQYLVAKELSPHCVCLMARRADLGDDRELANTVWKLDKINEAYRDFIDECEWLMRDNEEKREDTEINKLWRSYKDLIIRDPYLPKELLPKEWPAAEAKEIAKKTLTKLVDLTNGPTVVG